MLVLTRKAGERIRLRVPGHPDIWITALDHYGRNAFKLGIDAPPAVQITREEIIEDSPLDKDKEKPR